MLEVVECSCCNGSGWVVLDPDIGTEQTCWVCDGTGLITLEQKEIYDKED